MIYCVEDERNIRELMFLSDGIKNIRPFFLYWMHGVSPVFK